MKKILIGVGIGLCIVNTHANQDLVIQQGKPEPLNTTNVKQKKLNHSIILGYTKQAGEFKQDIDADLKGFTIGYSSSPYRHGFWGKVTYQQNKQYDGQAFDISTGAQLNLLSGQKIYSLISVGTGVSILDTEYYDTSTFLTIPVELELGFSPVQQFSIFGGVGYKWAININQDDNFCNDGTKTSSSGSGTCSHHQGINYSYQPYYIDDFKGVTYKAGIRYNF